jgi:arsenate reductase (glutaredoxin)
MLNMLKIYHNPKCKHSRAGLDYLKSKTSDFVVRDYQKVSITKDEINEIILKTNLAAKDLVRTQDEYYKKSLKGRNFTNEEWIKIIEENPKLLQRPIIVGKLKAIIANPTVEIDKLL